jgi:drug/metabolite transporter (DMT)-like permease
MTPSKKENLILGASVCTVGFFFAAATGACSKLVNPATPVLVILFFQNAICLLFNLPQITVMGYSALKTNKLGLHFLRDLTGFSSFLCLFAALKSIPLVEAMLLSYTEPLWIPFVALIWPGVRMRGSIWWGIGLGFLGIVFILQPSGEGLNAGIFLAILSGILAAVMLIVMHRLAATEPTHRTLFYNSLFGVLVTAPFALFNFSLLSTTDLFFLAGVGFFTYLSQFLITYAFKHGDATTLGTLAYTVVLFSGLLGWIFWAEVPNLVSFVGMALVIIGGILSVYFERKYQQKL